MVKYLFFNIGTSGLPKNSDFSTARLVQLSWLISDKKDFKKKQNIVNKVIKPNKFKISTGSINIHKITNEYAKKYGKDLSASLKVFYNDLKDCSFIVYHNIEFGLNVLLYEAKKCKDEDLIYKLNNINKICLGVTTKGLLKLKTFSGEIKMPRLTELYEWCFNTKMEKYNTTYNLVCMFKIYRNLIKKYKTKKEKIEEN